jgi:hypothetical protein
MHRIEVRLDNRAFRLAEMFSFTDYPTAMVPSVLLTG